MLAGITPENVTMRVTSSAMCLRGYDTPAATGGSLEAGQVRAEEEVLVVGPVVGERRDAGRRREELRGYQIVIDHPAELLFRGGGRAPFHHVRPRALRHAKGEDG